MNDLERESRMNPMGRILGKLYETRRRNWICSMIILKMIMVVDNMVAETIALDGSKKKPRKFALTSCGEVK